MPDKSFLPVDIDRADKFLGYLLIFLTAGFIALFLYTVLCRIFYPFDLEWMEGGFIMQGLWLLKGNPLYVAPTIKFIPFLYTPLMSWIAAAFLYVLGTGFWQVRLVSVFSTLGCAALIYLFVKRETGKAAAAFIAAGLLLGAYGVTGFYYDVIRVDNLLMFLAGTGFYFAFLPHTRRNVVLSAFFLSLSFFAKQTGLFYTAAVGLYYLLNDRKSCFLFSLCAAGFILIPVLYLQYTSHGWFSFYTFDIISTYSFKPGFVSSLFIPDLLYRLPGLTLLSLGYFLFYVRKKDWFGFLPIATATGIAASFLMRNKSGGVENCLIPMIFFEAVLAGIMISGIIKSDKVKLLAMALLLVQFYAFKYNPAYSIPGEADLKTGKKVLSYLRRQDSSVWLLDHTYHPAMLGRWPQIHNMAIYDVWRTGKPVGLSLKRMIEEKKFSKIITSYLTDDDRLHRYINRNYYQAALLLPPDDPSFYLKAGFLMRPQYVFLPRKGNDQTSDHVILN
ncbi:MAG: ArnT family glycosyltransferase [bacterium]